MAKKIAAYVPSSIRCPPMLDPFGRADYDEQQSVKGAVRRHPIVLPPLPSETFSWLDRQENNSSGERNSRRMASKDTVRREVENYYHMYFRFRMECWQSLVYAVKQSDKDDSVFSEDHLDRWTIKMKFRIKKASPLKEALLACSARLGLENDPDVIFCTDGFYGDSMTGRVRNRNEVPTRVVQSTSTCRAMGLCNGSCLFVSRATRDDRENAAFQMQVDLLNGQGVVSEEDSDEEQSSSGSPGKRPPRASLGQKRASRSSNRLSLDSMLDNVASALSGQGEVKPV